MSCPVKHNSNDNPTDLSSIPLKNLIPQTTASQTTPNTPQYNDAASDFIFDSHASPNQTLKLSTNREISSIPKSDFSPEHQPKGANQWVYPSEQQYYNAMKRKGYNPEEKDVPVILAIHNMVNEQGWSKVREWESLAGSPEPKLKWFIGRPKDISPKAYFLNLIG